MSETLEVEIAALQTLNLAPLQVKWRQVLNEAPPPHLKKRHS